jgi:hypothetical protein
VKKLKRITLIQIILYSLFVGLNLLELVWFTNKYLIYGGRIIFHQKTSFIQTLFNSELQFHGFLNLISYLILIIHLLIYNQYVKRNNLGKSYHWLIILLSFVPLINIFLHYFLWRKLNELIVISFGKNPKNSDKKIVILWILILFSTILGAFSFFILGYISSNFGLTSRVRFERIKPIIESITLLSVSMIHLSYSFEFRKAMKNRTFQEDEISDGQLLDG